MKHLIVLLLLLSSCSTIKKVFHRESHKTVKDSTSESETVIKEKLDTIIVIPADSVNGAKPFQNLIEGDTLEIESPTQTVKTFYDKLTKNVKTTAIKKPQHIPVNIDREIRQKVKTNVKVETEDKVKEKESEKRKPTWIWWLLVAAAIVYGAYRLSL